MTQPTQFQIWWNACRPKTLPAAIAPTVIGTAMAIRDESFFWPAALLALVGSILIQIGTNFANDYFDFVKGADTEHRLGPVRATQAGLVRPEAMKMAFILVFGLAALSGLYLAYRGGLPILIAGCLSIASGILYTGGPKPLGYIGLGDLFVLIFFGIVAVSGTYYVQALTLPSYVIIAGLGPGLLATAILTVNNLRDIETDRIAGKKTLAVRFGSTFARAEYIFTVTVASLIPVWLVLLTQEHFYALAAFLTLLLGLPTMKKVLQLKGAPLNPLLGETGKLLLVYSLLFSGGWILS